MKNLERIIKYYTPCPDQRLILIKRLINEFEAKGYLHYPLNDRHSLIFTKNERKCKGLLRKYESSPFPYLSNVEHFVTASGEWNKSLLTYGIKARACLGESVLSEIGSQIHLISRESLNYRSNQYLRLQYKRLRTLRNKGLISQYWNLSYKLMGNSWSFRLACLNNWHPIWYKNLRLNDLVHIWSKLNQILNFEEQRTIIKNVWIESPKGKWRQLCVPPKSWRLYFHMLNMFLSYLFSPHLSSQEYHGFIFNRGTKSWWQSVLWTPLLKQTQWILELDISSGFPNLNLHSVRKALKASQLIPEPVLNLILTHMTSPQESSQFFPTLSTYVEHYENLPWRISPRSVPMGIGISPILFVITQHWAFEHLNLRTPGFHSRWYADDFSFFFTSQWLYSFLTTKYNLFELLRILIRLENPIIHYLNQTLILKETGIKICTQKSGWVRTLGIWIKPYRSLGLSLECTSSPITQIFNTLWKQTETLMHLYSHTRGRGANPITGRSSTNPLREKFFYPSRNQEADLDLSYLIKNYESYFGLFLAKLYGGKLNHSYTRWTKQIKKNSPLWTVFPKINKELLPLDKFDKYNSGSKINRLILSFLFRESYSQKIVIHFPNLERVLKPSWSLINKSIMNQEFSNPLDKITLDPNPEKDYFKKFSEIKLTKEELEKYNTLFEQQKQSKT